MICAKEVALHVSETPDMCCKCSCKLKRPVPLVNDDSLGVNTAHLKGEKFRANDLELSFPSHCWMNNWQQATEFNCSNKSPE